MSLFPRPHDVDPSITSARVILAIKNFSRTPGVCHIGLGVTAANTQKVLRRHGVQTEVWSINKTPTESEAKLLWTELAKRENDARPITHVIVSSPAWIQPQDFQNLAMRWPNTTFVQLNHSGAAYLSIDKYGIRNIRDVVSLSEQFHNVRVAANNERVVKFISSLGADCLYLPNLYDTATFQNPIVPPRLGNTLRVGSFGASRPWKNQLCAAEAAIMMGKALGCRVELYVNSKRPDGGERMIESRQELFTGMPHAKIVDVPWMPWTKFRDLGATMHCQISCSFDETFCVVAADGIAEGVPSVTSSALEWTPRNWWAECEDPSDIMRVGLGLVHNPIPAVHEARVLLQKYVSLGTTRWLDYLTGKPQTLV
jgi:hypothetical protein